MFVNHKKLGSLVVLTAAMLCATTAHAAERRIKSKASPVYPELAKRMNVSGTVKLEVTVAPSGSVTQVKPMGGHPLLIQSATDAAKSMRYEPASGETTEVIEFHFMPQ